MNKCGRLLTSLVLYGPTQLLFGHMNRKICKAIYILSSQLHTSNLSRSRFLAPLTSFSGDSCLHGQINYRQTSYRPDIQTSYRPDIQTSYSQQAATTQTLMANRALPDSSMSKPAQQNFDFFLVLDFEATCDNKQRLHPQEIIEFPVLKMNARTQKVESVFHHYVLPQYHPQLTSFCTQLTGIVQDMVTNQLHLVDILKNFDVWMTKEGLLEPEVKSIFVTCGDWDLKTMLPKQCEHLAITPAFYFQRWVNIKKSFADVTGTFPKGLMDMLAMLGHKHTGRLHSGIDDCHNISTIIAALIQRGYIFKENGAYHF